MKDTRDRRREKRLYYQKNQKRKCEAQQKYHAEHRAERSAYRRERIKRLRNAVLDGFGAVCVCCGELERRFLTIDHIENDGAIERRGKGAGGEGLYLRLIREKFPTDRYRILCANCNFGRALNGGVCPHQVRS